MRVKKHGQKFLIIFLGKFRDILICCQTRLVAMNLQWRGVFWRLETTSNDLDPDFDRSSIRLSRCFSPNNRWSPKKRKRSFLKLRRFFSPNLGDLKKKKKKEKGLQPGCNPVFWSKSHQVSEQFLLPTQGGGLFSFLEQKSASKVLKSGVFCILFRPMGRAIAPAPLATLLFRTTSIHNNSVVW